jgi:transcriptional regulator with XRE-family HTH domain
MATIPENIGKRVELFREAKGWRQTDLADRLTEYLPKWSRQAVWSAERGEREFTATELSVLSLVLEKSIPLLLEPTDLDEPISLSDETTIDADSLSVLWSDPPSRADATRVRAADGAQAEEILRRADRADEELRSIRRAASSIVRRSGAAVGTRSRAKGRRSS